VISVTVSLSVTLNDFEFLIPLEIISTTRNLSNASTFENKTFANRDVITSKQKLSYKLSFTLL